MTTLDKEAIKVFVKTQIAEAESSVAKLEARISSLSEELAEKKHEVEAAQEYYRLSFEAHANGATSKMAIDAPLRFANMTQKAVCTVILREKGPLHVADISRIAGEGGKELAKKTITTVLIRGKEFEAVKGKPNTFRLKSE